MRLAVIVACLTLAAACGDPSVAGPSDRSEPQPLPLPLPTPPTPSGVAQEMQVHMDSLEVNFALSPKE